MVSDSGKNSQRKEKSYSDQTQKASKRRFEQIREILRYFNQNLPSISKMGNKGKDKEHSNAGARGDGADPTQEVHDAHKASRDLSHERQATLDKMIMDAVAWLTAMFLAILNGQAAVSIPTSL